MHYSSEAHAHVVTCTWGVEIENYWEGKWDKKKNVNIRVFHQILPFLYQLEKFKDEILVCNQTALCVLQCNVKSIPNMHSHIKA